MCKILNKNMIPTIDTFDLTLQKMEGITPKEYEEVVTEKSISITVYDVAKTKGKLVPFGRTLQDGEPTPENPVPIENVEGERLEIKVANGNDSTAQGYQEQTILFPLAENQKLMEGDYLAEDGVHHVREQRIFVGANDEGWDIRNDTHEMRINLGADAIYNSILKSDKLKQVSAFTQTGSNVRWVLNSTKICISSDFLDTANMTLADWKTWLNNNNLVIEYGITETVEPYTPAQAESYINLKNCKLFKGTNHIFTIMETLKPNLQLTYYKEKEEE